MSTYNNLDNCTDLILDFIAGGVADNPSGESGGNYNAIIGEPNSTRNLSRYNLVDIADLQHELINGGNPSSAVGRYQIIDRTLQTLIAELGLPKETMFTPALQDRLASH